MPNSQPDEFADSADVNVEIQLGPTRAPGAGTGLSTADTAGDAALAARLQSEEQHASLARPADSAAGTRTTPRGARSPGGLQHTPSYQKKQRAKYAAARLMSFAPVARHTPWFCAFIFITCLVTLVYSLYLNEWTFMPFAENPTLGPSTAVLLDLGAKRRDLIVDQGDWWRLFSSMFLHAGVMHFAFNMIGMYNVGVPLEREFGWLSVGALYLFSGLFAALFSTIFVPQSVGVGASGAIFGLFGASWSDLLINWSLYKGMHCKVFFGLFMSTAVNLGIGLVPMLDNFAHFGGFICGFVCGFAFLVEERVDGLGQKKQRKFYQNALQTVASVTFPLMLLVAVIVLYVVTDADEWCPACSKISCLEFPPRAWGGEPWWDCGKCANDGANALLYNATYMELTCPANQGMVGVGAEGITPEAVAAFTTPNSPNAQDQLIQICKVYCQD